MGELLSASSETPLFAMQASGIESMLLSQISAETVYNVYIENCDRHNDDGTDLSASNVAISIMACRFCEEFVEKPRFLAK